MGKAEALHAMMDAMDGVGEPPAGFADMTHDERMASLFGDVRHWAMLCARERRS